MREITNKTELSEFFRDKLLPYYEQHYSEDLTLDDAKKLNLQWGVCFCAKKQFNVLIYEVIMVQIRVYGFLTGIMYLGFSAKESLLPRIEWMRQFINDNK